MSDIKTYVDPYGIKRCNKTSRTDKPKNGCMIYNLIGNELHIQFVQGTTEQINK